MVGIFGNPTGGNDWIANVLGAANNITHGSPLPPGIGTAFNSGMRTLMGVPQKQYISGNAMPSPSYVSPDPLPPSQPQDSGGGSNIDAILQQLQALQDPSRYMMDQASIERQARSAASQQYDPIIAGIRNQMGLATDRGNRNKATVGQMFNELSGSIAGDLPKVQQQYDSTIQNTDKRYADLQNQIQGTYNDSRSQQEQTMKRLNIEAAAPQVLDQQNKDQAFFTNRSKEQGATTADALTQMKQGAVDFTNAGAVNSKKEGVQRQSDIMTQLSDMLGQFEGQVSANEAAKAQAYTSGLQSLSSQAATQASTKAQNDFQNYIASVNLGRGLQSDQLAQLKQMQSTIPTAVKSLADVAPRAMGMGLPAPSAQKLQSAFTTGLGDPLVIASVDPTTGQQLSAEAKATRIREQGQQQGLSQQELNALQIMALEYFNRR